MFAFLRTGKITLKHPELVTVNDCNLAYQMGYEVQVCNGQVTGFRKRKKR